ncbi:MAG: DUF2490 domain-containing protein [Bacteroidota bacterium]
MQKGLIYIFTLIFCVIFLPVHSQDKDFGLWTSVELEKDLSKNLELEIGIENRLEDNLNQRDETFFDTGLSYRKGIFVAGFGYRITNKNERGGSSGYSHRFIGQMRLRPEWKRFSFDYRARFQKQYFNIYSSENGHIPENFIRNRVRAGYNIRKTDLEPSISYELFYLLDHREKGFFQKGRFKLELSYEINKKNSLEISYIVQETINEADLQKTYVIGIGYKYEI